MVNENAVLLNGDCLVELKSLPDNSLDSLVTDPPAGISFMGKAWDDDKGGRKQWVAWMTEVMTEALRVLKPGAHGLVWALPRTSHWTATALEDAGFEIRDVVTHLFGSGFPKSLDVSKAIDKAAGAERTEKFVRPDFAARSNKKPSAESQCISGPKGEYSMPATEAAKKWQGWGTALKPASEHWILVRKPCSEKTVAANVLKWGTGAINIDASRIGNVGGTGAVNHAKKADGRLERWDEGRFPANLVFDEEAAAMLDVQSGDGETGPSRFFYVAKASKSDKGSDNTHPTVKSTKLMSYLIKMITPPNGVVLDPFMGSGTTGVAALELGFVFIGIEKDEQYYTICQNRMAAEKAA